MGVENVLKQYKKIGVLCQQLKSSTLCLLIQFNVLYTFNTITYF